MQQLKRGIRQEVMATALIGLHVCTLKFYIDLQVVYRGFHVCTLKFYIGLQVVYRGFHVCALKCYIGLQVVYIGFHVCALKFNKHFKDLIEFIAYNSNMQNRPKYPQQLNILGLY